jgi:hypothetical protein
VETLMKLLLKSSSGINQHAAIMLVLVGEASLLAMTTVLAFGPPVLKYAPLCNA